MASEQKQAWWILPPWYEYGIMVLWAKGHDSKELKNLVLKAQKQLYSHSELIFTTALHTIIIKSTPEGILQIIILPFNYWSMYWYMNTMNNLLH